MNDISLGQSDGKLSSPIQNSCCQNKVDGLDDITINTPKNDLSPPMQINDSLINCEGLNGISLSHTKNTFSNSHHSLTCPKTLSAKTIISQMINEVPGPQKNPHKLVFLSPIKTSSQLPKSPTLSSILLGQSSPIIILNSPPNKMGPKHLSSPPPISNRFGPLIRPNNPSSSSGSSFLGPIYPPGFEQTISPQKKQIHERKRKRRLLKKRLKARKNNKLTTSSPKSLENSQDQPSHSYHISAEDTMQIASKIGVSYSGSSAQFKMQIQSIIDKQVQDWKDNQP